MEEVAAAPRRGCYPGTFDPPTHAHLAIASAALGVADLTAVDFVLSRDPLGKPRATPVDARARVLDAVRMSRAWIGVRVVDSQLIADVAAGYDVVILGADKWAQVIDPAWYGGSLDARDRAVAALPPVLLVPRPGFPTPPGVACLEVDPMHAEVSSSGVRDGGRVEWMLPEAVAAGLWSPG